MSTATTSVERVFVDTNILTRATILSSPLHAEAVQTLIWLRESSTELWISNQVIREYVANATRPQTYSKPIPISRVLEQVRRFRAQFKVAEDTTVVLDMMLALLGEFRTGGKQIHDLNIVATMLGYGINSLLTHNVQDFKRFESKINLIPLDAEILSDAADSAE